MDPPSRAETDAHRRLSRARCSGGWAYMPLVLGLGQYCHGKDAEAAGLAVAGALELGAGILVGRREGLEHPGAAIPFVAYQDAYLAGLSDMLIDRKRAEHAPYAPTDSLADLLAAPFNIEVMKRPKVWVGLLAVLAVGIGASVIVDGGLPESMGNDVNLFGHDFDPAVGYPLGTALGAGLFSHVAPAEELFFRGVVQSSLARSSGETMGWIGGSLIFGLAHAPNALALEEEDRKSYLLIGVPVITLAGSYLGYLYKDSGYSLAPPTAVHFWYDLLLTTTFFAIDPQSSPFAANLRFRF